MIVNSCADLEDLAANNEEADEHSNDPLATLDLVDYIRQNLRSIHTSDPAGFESLCSSLNKSQVQTIQSIFN